MYTRDENYYFTGTLITIRIEDCLFRVPRHRFEEHSEVFCKMYLSTPPGRESVKENGTDENPIHIGGIDKQSFRFFLTILYPLPDVRCSETKSRETLGQFTNNSSASKAEKWIDILVLAHAWQFAEIRDLAIASLEHMPLPEVRKVEIAHAVGIQNWYMPAYKALVKRSGALSVKEATQLGFEFAIKLAGIRERWIARTSRTPAYVGLRSCLESESETTPDDAALEADIIATLEVKLPSP